MGIKWSPCYSRRGKIKTVTLKSFTLLCSLNYTKVMTIFLLVRISVYTIKLLYFFICNYRVLKENRAAGILDNHAEGEKYSQHALRKYVRNKSPEIMPSINSFFADPNYWCDVLMIMIVLRLSMIENVFFSLIQQRPFRHWIHK